MQRQDDESPDATSALFDVVIGMPPGAQLETIQHLAMAQAGLTTVRAERLITVLRTSPNAKVGSALTLMQAEAEKERFIKAGLLVEITPAVMDPAAVNSSYGKLFDDYSPKKSIPAALHETPDFQSRSEKKAGLDKIGLIHSKSALALASLVAVVMSALYAGEKGLTIGGMQLPWAKKELTAAAAVSRASSQLSTAADATAAGAAFGEAEAEDPLIQAANSKRAAPPGLAGAVGAADSATKLTKQLLTADFATLLAEMSQGARAREVLKALAGSLDPAADARVEPALLAAQLKLLAWSVQRMDAVQAKQTVDELKTKIQAIANAQNRTQLQGQVAVILSRHAQLPSDVPRTFLSAAAESVKAVEAGQASTALGNLAVSMAEVFLIETAARAKTGAWAKAKASATQVEDLIKQAPDAWTQTRLHAVDHQAKLHTGQADKAAKSLESALAWAGKNNNLPERAVWLRAIAQLSDAGTQEQFDAAANSLQSQLVAKSGMEKAQGLTDLSLLYTSAGLPGKAAQLRGLAQATTGLSAAETASINTDLTVRGDMAMAKMLHGLGRYAEAESALQRVSGYLY